MIVTKISSKSPDHQFENPFTEQLPTSELADPAFNQPEVVEALMGVGIWAEIVIDEIRRVVSPDQLLMAQKTSLGWVVSGQLSTCKLQEANRCMTIIDNAQLDASIRRFWEIENGPKQRVWTTEEKLAEEIFVATHTRDSTGRYVVTIPRKLNPPALGESRSLAIGCFRSLERKFARDPDLYQKYRTVIDDYMAKGHFIVAATATSATHEQYFIPHHPINATVAPQAKRKFRVVFNASAPSTTGASFNDQHLTGPKLQQDLCELFLRFRLKRFALTADIVQMFRQVGVHERDWQYQKIIWRDAPQHQLRELQCTVVMWGTASASFNAVRALRQCAMDEGADFPLGAEIVLNDFYMDDLLHNADTEKQLKDGYDQASSLLARGGFVLDKLISNSEQMTTTTKPPPPHFKRKMVF